MGELILNEVSTPSTPAAGKDSIYMTSATLPRLTRVDSAGNVWPLQEMWMMSLSANYTLTNGNSAQQAFNATGSGQLTVPSSSAYLFQGMYLITNTGTTSHTWSILFGGAATLTSGAMSVNGVTNTAATVAAASTGYTTTLGSAFVATAASTSATENVVIAFEGVVRINAGGTFIPQVKLSAAPGGTQTMLANSYIVLTPFGTNTATSLGPWT